MVFLDFMLLELCLVLIAIYFVISNNIMILLYNAGIYLILAGAYSLLNDADIYIGFLWVIDLGVGLIFFIFMLHFLSFLHQKSKYLLLLRYYTISGLLAVTTTMYFYSFSVNIDSTLNYDLGRVWSFYITYLDYYFLYFTNEITELNVLRESYFLVNSFEFFLVNFSLLFGLVSCILLCFLVHKIFNFLNFSQITQLRLLSKVDTNFFIRNQNFITQQNTVPNVKIWRKFK